MRKKLKYTFTIAINPNKFTKYSFSRDLMYRICYVYSIVQFVVHYAVWIHLYRTWQSYMTSFQHGYTQITNIQILHTLQVKQNYGIWLIYGICFLSSTKLRDLLSTVWQIYGICFQLQIYGILFLRSTTVNYRICYLQYCVTNIRDLLLLDII